MMGRRIANIDEKALIKMCIANDRKSQRIFYDRHAAFINGVASRYTKCSFDRKDIFLRSFEKIFLNLHKFNSDTGHLKPWMARITINESLNLLKSQKRKRHEEIPENLASIHYKNEQHSDLEYLINIIRKLKHPYGLIFNLIQDGFKHKEIAEILKISEATSRSYYKRSRDMIQAEILEEDKHLRYEK